MIKYTTLILLLVLGCGLLVGCGDPAVQLAMSRAEVKKINEASERETERHQLLITDLENKNDIETLVKESKVELTDGFWVRMSGKSMPAVNYSAADALLSKIRPKLPKNSPILVASFVNIDDLSDSSTFGRVVAEQFASRFKQNNYTTIEMKLRTNVFIREGSGEFLLSREVAEIGDKHRAQAVVVGTYAVASKEVYLTARVINVSDGRVLSSYDYNIPISRDVFKLLLKDKNKAGWL
ncbi:MAG: FlgO family outer membrane protein [Phycisphaerae bacterium]|nr:FlgO family outer membrane protein [Phycisphaerae bacterium]